MRRLSILAMTLATTTISLFSAGCGSDSSAHSSPAPVDEPIEISGLPPGLGELDDHGDQGPHGGYIVELGRKHEYHAELVENYQTGTVSVYILDHKLRELSIEQQVISLHLTVAGDIASYQLAPVITGGTSASRFSVLDRDLCSILEGHESVTGKLRVTIAGKPFVGQIAHSHHSGCDHGHQH